MALLRFAAGLSLIICAGFAFVGVLMLMETRNPALLLIAGAWGVAAILFFGVNRIVELLTDIRTAVSDGNRLRS